MCYVSVIKPSLYACVVFSHAQKRKTKVTRSAKEGFCAYRKKSLGFFAYLRVSSGSFLQSWKERKRGRKKDRKVGREENQEGR